MPSNQTTRRLKDNSSMSLNIKENKSTKREKIKSKKIQQKQCEINGAYIYPQTQNSVKYTQGSQPEKSIYYQLGMGTSERQSKQSNIGLQQSLIYQCNPYQQINDYYTSTPQNYNSQHLNTPQSLNNYLKKFDSEQNYRSVQLNRTSNNYQYDNRETHRNQLHNNNREYKYSKNFTEDQQSAVLRNFQKNKHSKTCEKNRKYRQEMIDQKIDQICEQIEERSNRSKSKSNNKSLKCEHSRSHIPKTQQKNMQQGKFYDPTPLILKSNKTLEESCANQQQPRVYHQQTPINNRRQQQYSFNPILHQQQQISNNFKNKKKIQQQSIEGALCYSQLVYEEPIVQSSSHSRMNSYGSLPVANNQIIKYEQNPYELGYLELERKLSDKTILMKELQQKISHLEDEGLRKQKSWLKKEYNLLKKVSQLQNIIEQMRKSQLSMQNQIQQLNEQLQTYQSNKPQQNNIIIEQSNIQCKQHTSDQQDAYLLQSYNLNYDQNSIPTKSLLTLTPSKNSSAIYTRHNSSVKKLQYRQEVFYQIGNSQDNKQNELKRMNDRQDKKQTGIVKDNAQLTKLWLNKDLTSMYHILKLQSLALENQLR